MRTRRANSRTVSVCPLLYRSRNLVERFFNKLKHFRAVATRYDKDPDSSWLPSNSHQPESGAVRMSRWPKLRACHTNEPASERRAFRQPLFELDQGADLLETRVWTPCLIGWPRTRRRGPFGRRRSD